MALIYCSKKKGNHSSCGSLATHQCVLQSKSDSESLECEISYRCNGHKGSQTVKKCVIAHNPIDQSKELAEVNRMLHSYVGKEVPNKVHTCYPIGKYLKGNGGIIRRFNFSNSLTATVLYCLLGNVILII